MDMINYHESAESLSPVSKDFSRALNSLKEEIEAIDWYQQRADVTKDKQLQKILLHNQFEEMEHACMVIEWLRRNMQGWDERLNTYLFTETEISKINE
jgi:uncharacterized protein